MRGLIKDMKCGPWSSVRGGHEGALKVKADARRSSFHRGSAASNQKRQSGSWKTRCAIAPGAFTIGRIMVVIAVVAGLLALPLQLSLIVIALAIPSPPSP